MNGVSQTEAAILQTLTSLERRVAELVVQVEELTVNFSEITRTKEWYSTAEVAELMGVTRHTVQERWCNQGKIACEKDHSTGKWRIPGHEYERLRCGGRREGI